VRRQEASNRQEAPRLGAAPDAQATQPPAPLPRPQAQRATRAHGYAAVPRPCDQDPSRPAPRAAPASPPRAPSPDRATPPPTDAHGQDRPQVTRTPSIRPRVVMELQCSRFSSPINPSLHERHQWHNGRPPFLFPPPAPSLYKIRPSPFPLFLLELPLPLSHPCSPTPSQSAPPSVEPRRSLYLTVPCSTDHSPSSTFIPAHEQEPKVEDNPKMLIYFLKHVLN
jgi:hypothetical protein